MDIFTAAIVLVANLPFHMAAYYLYLYWTYELKIQLNDTLTKLAHTQADKTKAEDRERILSFDYHKLLDEQLAERAALKQDSQAMTTKLLTNLTKKD